MARTGARIPGRDHGLRSGIERRPATELHGIGVVVMAPTPWPACATARTTASGDVGRSAGRGSRVMGRMGRRSGNRGSPERRPARSDLATRTDTAATTAIPAKVARPRSTHRIVGILPMSDQMPHLRQKPTAPTRVSASCGSLKHAWSHRRFSASLTCETAPRTCTSRVRLALAQGWTGRGGVPTVEPPALRERRCGVGPASGAKGKGPRRRPLPILGSSSEACDGSRGRARSAGRRGRTDGCRRAEQRLGDRARRRRPDAASSWSSRLRVQQHDPRESSRRVVPEDQVADLRASARPAGRRRR